MNLEKYKSEMNGKYPDRAVTEIALSRAKREAEKPKGQLLKNIGAFGLSAAVLVGAFFGAGAVRSLFKDINRQEAEETTITEGISETDPVITETNEQDGRIIATDEYLAATPLSNPKYTVKANTPDGKVSLDEHTTIEEMLACGVPVVTEDGLLGTEYLCEAFRKYRNYENFEFIIADTLEGANRYSYYNYTTNKSDYREGYEDNVLYRVYKHKYGQSITTYSGLGGNSFAELRAGDMEGAAAIVLDNFYNSEMLDNVGIITTYDTYGVTGFDKEVRKQMYFDDLTVSEDTRMPDIVNIIYNGECYGKYRMNLFLEKIENGAQYAGVQYTDITTTDEYDERVYSIEYCNGVYSIFTMTDGLDGKFDTRYFDGYAVTDGVVVFDNGEVKYTFMLSENVEADVEKYGDNLREELNMWYPNNNAVDHLKLIHDFEYTRTLYKAAVEDLLVINEEQSKDGYNALEVEIYSAGDYQEAELKLDMSKDRVIGTSNNGSRFILNSVMIFRRGDEEPIVTLGTDGRFYVMYTDAQLEALKNSGRYMSIHLYENDGMVEQTWLVDMDYYDEF